MGDISKKSDLTLFQWIAAKEPNESLENIVKVVKNSLLKVSSVNRRTNDGKLVETRL